MTTKRKDNVDRRNITLHPDTYERLDRFLLELMQKNRDPKTSRNDAIEALLEEHEKRSKA